MSEPSVLVIQHTAGEGPGLLAEVLPAAGLSLRRVRVFRGDPVPQRLGDHAGLVVLGGPMGVYEPDRYPFLRREIRLVADALERQRPILGICLGSQLLAAALGTPVTRGQVAELGWAAVTLSREAATDGLWAGVPESFNAFHWHGDYFELPRGAVRLAWSQAADCQAFRHQGTAYGVLFHLEVTERIVRGLVRSSTRALGAAGLSAAAILDSLRAHLPALHQIGRQVFARWARLVRDEPAPPPAGPRIQVKRVYEPAAPEEGARFLVDRLWPRGVKREALRLADWLQQVAPSTALRQWYHRHPDEWAEFRRRYFVELDQHPEAVRPLVEAAARGPVTLLFSSANRDRNNAVALREYLLGRLTGAVGATP
jgi:GMP synthase (glutamine-hydrolysing)